MRSAETSREPSENCNFFMCDGCSEHATALDSGELPKDWRVVHAEGWIGDFHVCSLACEISVRRRYEQGEKQ